MVLEQSERGTGESYRNDFIEEPSAVIRDYYADPQGITGFSDMATMEIKGEKVPEPIEIVFHCAATPGPETKASCKNPWIFFNHSPNDLSIYSFDIRHIAEAFQFFHVIVSVDCPH